MCKDVQSFLWSHKETTCFSQFSLQQSNGGLDCDAPGPATSHLYPAISHPLGVARALGVAARTPKHQTASCTITDWKLLKDMTHSILGLVYFGVILFHATVVVPMVGPVPPFLWTQALKVAPALSWRGSGKEGHLFFLWRRAKHYLVIFRIFSRRIKNH